MSAVLLEMIDVLCADMYKKRVQASVFTWWVSYDYKSLEKLPYYDGPVSIDFYGRLHPAHNNGTVRLITETDTPQLIAPAIAAQFDERTDHRLLYRRLGVCACDVKETGSALQIDFFTDYEKLDRDRRLQGAMLEVRAKLGANSIFTGKNLLEGATTLDRNQQIGGHRA